MKILLAFILSSLVASSIYSQGNYRAAQLNSMIEEGMTDWNIPGLSAVVVKEGEIVFS